MNRINPFIAAAVIFLVFIALAFTATRKNSELKAEAKALSGFEESAKRVSVLKKTWDKTNLEDKIKSVFAGSLGDKGGVFEIRANSLSQSDANEMIRKALGDAFEISKFELTKEGGESYSLVLEIAK